MTAADVTARTDQAEPKVRLPTLDGYRALAALAVVVFHVTGRIGREVSDHPLGLHLDSWLAPLGNYGVCVFFVLSGFLLYRPFVLAHLRGSPAPGLRRYFRRRILRIFPAYWMVLVVVVVVLAPNVAGIRVPKTTGGLAAHAALVQTYAPTGFAEGLGVAWTLCIELAFYLMLPVFALAIISLPGGRSRDPSDRVAAQLCGVTILYTMAWAYRFLPAVHEAGGVPAHLWLPAYLDWFALGMALAVAHAWRSTGGRLPSVLQFLSDRPGLAWFLAAQIYWVGVQLNIEVSLTTRPEFGQQVGRFAVNGFSSALLLLPGVLGTRRTLGLRALDARVLGSLGTISYGIYLWHVPVLKLSDRAGIAQSFVPLFTMTMVCTLGLATLSYHLVERPAMAWRSRGRPVPSAASRPVVAT